MSIAKKLAGLALALAVATAAQAAPVRKDELVIGLTQFPSTLHPNIDAMVAKSYVLGMTRRPLTAYDKDWKLVCLLCVELPTLENGLAKPGRTPEGRQGIAVTYSLHPEARWGDGKALTSHDVEFTWQVGRHPRTGVGNMEFYRSLYKVEIKDDRTFTLHFDKLTFDYNDASDFNLLPAHLESEAFEANPAEYKNRTTFDTKPTHEGLSAGPYLIAKIDPGAQIVLEPNPLWWGAKPHFRRIVLRVIENTAALEANLLSGAIDMIAGELGLTLDQALAFEKRNAGRYRVLYKPGLIYEHVDFNLDNPILADKRVRHALALAADRETIGRQLFGGRQPVAHGNVNPLDWAYSDAVPHYPHDPKRAAALLDEAGWKTLKAGIRHNAKGEPLRLELATTAGNRTRETIQQVLQAQWKQVGIEVRLRNQPARVLFGETVRQRRFEGMTMYAWSSSPESVPRTTLHSAHVPTPENGYAGQNYTGFRNEEVDALIETIEVELDRAKRKALWHRLQEIYATELPSLPLYFRADPFILPLWLEGLEPTGHQYPSTLWVEQWRVR
ncbi:MAG: peptide ABC transporter substrate-binding protein [Magnetospirillum sp. WYHS-4]